MHNMQMQFMSPELYFNTITYIQSTAIKQVK